jgi:hypothetical protein
LVCNSFLWLNSPKVNAQTEIIFFVSKGFFGIPKDYSSKLEIFIQIREMFQLFFTEFYLLVNYPNVRKQ